MTSQAELKNKTVKCAEEFFQRSLKHSVALGMTKYIFS